MSDDAFEAFDLARGAAEKLCARTFDTFDVALVMGSGWVPAADALGEPAEEIPVTDLPGFLPPSVQGHAGLIRAVEVAGRRVLVFLGRTHLYEGRGVASVVHGVRTALYAGVRTVVLTNAAGGLRPEGQQGQPGQQVGDPVVISDHINLTGVNPMSGPAFVDMTEAYSPRLRALVREVDPNLADGVYAGLHGPTFETPAEIRMLRAMGADLVGMSTALETIAARAGVPEPAGAMESAGGSAGPGDGTGTGAGTLTAEVLGISLVTNIAAGLTGQLLNHEEVLEAGRASAARVGRLLASVVTRL